MFAVKPAEPMPLKGKLSFGVYDPTMYTAMDFPTDEDLTRSATSSRPANTRSCAPIRTRSLPRTRRP